jgi:hypothetical protein
VLEQQKGISGAVLAGVIVGTVVVLIFTIAVMIKCCRKK